MISAAIYTKPGNLSRARAVTDALASGVRAVGWRDARTPMADARSAPHDLAMAYGWAEPHVFDAYRDAGKPFVYVDLGYWGRKAPGDELGGYHKVCVSERHPNSMIGRCFPATRWREAGLNVKPWRTSGRHVLLAGLSAKAAASYGFGPQEWEYAIIGQIRRYTARPIVYRPKPSWTNAPAIPGTRFSPAGEALAAVLADCWAVVTHHSNVQIDAMLAGVPFFAEHGAGIGLRFPLDMIDAPPPYRAGDREAVLNDLAWCQWTLAEIAAGECFRFYRAHGLLP